VCRKIVVEKSATQIYAVTLAPIKMKKIAIIILSLITFISCWENKNKAINSNNRVDKKVVFDSSYYFQLNKAYTENDTLLLSEFFKNWNKLSEEKNNNDNQLTITIERIFNEIYHPFELEKYGWLPRKHYLKYKYAVLPNEIKYKIVDNLQNSDKIHSISFDTIKDFYPKPDIGNAKILYDIEPFSTSMKIFLNEDGFQKTFFLNTNNFIITPISSDWKDYRTTPEILGVLINKRMDSAIVNLRLISTGVRIILTKENDDWKMQKVKKLWIE